MHTFTHENTRLQHHGDFSGNVTVLPGPTSTGAKQVEIGVPFSAILGPVASYVRPEKIRALEQADDHATVMGHLRQDEA